MSPHSLGRYTKKRLSLPLTHIFSFSLFYVCLYLSSLVIVAVAPGGGGGGVGVVFCCDLLKLDIYATF